MKLTTTGYWVVVIGAAIISIALIVPFYSQVGKSIGNIFGRMDGITGKEAVQGLEVKGMDARYFYIVSDKARGYLDGVETETFEDYQWLIGVEQDGVPGPKTYQATCFYNASDRMGL